MLFMQHEARIFGVSTSEKQQKIRTLQISWVTSRLDLWLKRQKELLVPADAAEVSETAACRANCLEGWAFGALW